MTNSDLRPTESFLILRKTRYSESDLIIHALSSKGERCAFYARGALKSKKRFGGGILEPSHFVRLTYQVSKMERGLPTLIEASLINDFLGLRKNYDKLETALNILECVYRVSQEGDVGSPELFNLVGNTLKALDIDNDHQRIRVHFYLKFLLQQGVLVVEDWMHPWLRVNIFSEGAVLVSLPLTVSTESRQALELRVRKYLETATMI